MSPHNLEVNEQKKNRIEQNRTWTDCNKRNIFLRCSFSHHLKIVLTRNKIFLSFPNPQRLQTIRYLLGSNLGKMKWVNATLGIVEVQFFQFLYLPLIFAILTFFLNSYTFPRIFSCLASTSNHDRVRREKIGRTSLRSILQWIL